MRRYRPNSPEAMARVLAMTLLADARLDDRELAAMERLQIYRLLGVTELEFASIVSDYCSDLVRSSAGSHAIDLLDSARIAEIVSEVDEPKRRLELARVILTLLKSDGEFSDSELSMLRQVLNHWNLSIDDLRSTPKQ